MVDFGVELTKFGNKLRQKAVLLQMNFYFYSLILNRHIQEFDDGTVTNRQDAGGERIY
jgi:hypothetical protein